MNEVQETLETNEVAPTKKVKIKNSTPNIGKFYRSRQRVIVPHDRTYDAGRNKAKSQRKATKKAKRGELQYIAHLDDYGFINKE